MPKYIDPTPTRPNLLPRDLNFRVPAGTPPEVARLTDRALQRYEDVMEERVDFRMAPSVLRAAQLIREEGCGPVPRDVKIQGTLSLEQLVLAASAPAPPAEPIDELTPVDKLHPESDEPA